jgi:tRNA threonylcarbamoyladenosine biosynthesis protein TsaB
MKILALEFSSAQRSVAVTCGAGHVREVIETSKGHTMQPFAMIETALEQANIERHEIERIVVGLGPGSYTGIRAGIALAQGWQLARTVELIGISSVEAIKVQAHADGLRGTVTVIVDAQRGEFYLATWELSDTGCSSLEPLHIVSADAAKSRAEAGECIIGPEVTRWFPAGKIVFPRAATLAKLALDETAAASSSLLEPIYLRETTFVKAPAPRVV